MGQVPKSRRGELYEELQDVLCQLSTDDLKILRGEALHVRRFFARGVRVHAHVNIERQSAKFRRSDRAVTFIAISYSLVALFAALIMIGASQLLPHFGGLVAVGPLLLGAVSAGNLIAFGCRLIGD